MRRPCDRLEAGRSHREGLTCTAETAGSPAGTIRCWFSACSRAPCSACHSSSDGRTVREPPVQVFKTTNRYRDIAVHPDQRVMYLATDPTGRTSDDSGASTQSLANPGSILEFTYAGN